jgi:hypothetical protein
MSRGLGLMERAVLDAIARWGAISDELGEHVTRVMVAEDIAVVHGWPTKQPTRAQLVSVNRAIRSLKRKGLVEETGWSHTLLLTDAGLRECQEGL